LASVIRVFIGYDSRESVAYHTCVQSILENTKSQVSFHPVCGERRDGSNDFIYARFLVPWLCGFSGPAIFVDGDMIVRGDIAELAALHRNDQGVQVVKHDYKTKYPVKYLGNKNEDYPRKNQSSVMVWNCGYFPNKKLTPEYVASKSGSFLHRFLWLNEGQIGGLPESWNRLVLEQPIQADDKLLHFTIGIPAFQEYADCDGAEEWHATLGRALLPLQR
jgi:hypothetical protein